MHQEKSTEPPLLFKGPSSTSQAVVKGRPAGCVWQGIISEILQWLFSGDSLLPCQFFLKKAAPFWPTLLNSSLSCIFPDINGFLPFPSNSHNACDWIIVFLLRTKSCPLHSRSNQHTFIWLMLSQKTVSVVLPDSSSTACWCWISLREFYFRTAFLLPSSPENASVNSGCLSFRGEHIDI